MPEDQSAGPDLGRVLEHLDDFALNAQNYQTIQDALEKTQGNIEVSVVEKLLALCVRDLKEDMKNTVNTLKVLAAVLKKIKAGELYQLPDLVPSAVAVLHIIKTTALLNKVEGLKMLCYEILQSYPNEILITLAVSHYSEIMEMLNLYCHQRIPLEMRMQPINIIYKLLKILPPDKRTIFVRDGVGIWFSKIVPTVMSFATNVNGKNTVPLETLEMLTEELVGIDYLHNPNWKAVLECVHTQQKYPAVIKDLLDSGSDIWYRLWIIFIKLLKNQITKINTSGKLGSPINSMLPAVETAFKMNVKNRCRAFLCWNVLIDNFSTETNEIYINKRLKLLMIPLTSNNAKVEETVIAKLNTWWHLIRQFETKIESCFETIVLPFLHFCFGKTGVKPEKPVFAPGLLTINTKRQVLQAFANIAGHVNCDCTVNMSKLSRKILNSTNLLVDHWDNWTNSLTMTIRICVNDNSDSVMQHFKCIWKSFIANIAEVSKSTDRYNLFVELLAILEVLLQSPRCDKLADIIFNIVTYSLIDHNGKVQPLFNAKNEKNSPIHKIVSLILNPSLDYVFTRYDAKEIVAKIKPLTKLIAEEYLKEVTEGYLKSPLVKNNSLMLWTALAEAICELKCDISVEILQHLLILPLKSMSLFTSVEISSSAWFLLYKYGQIKLHDISVDEEICEIISNQSIISTTNKIFIFRASLVICNNIIADEKDNLICKVAETLHHVTNEIEYTSKDANFSCYSNIILFLLEKVYNEPNEKLAKVTVSIANNLLKMMSQYYKQEYPDKNLESNLVVQVLEQMQLLFKKEIYTHLKSIVLDDLKKFIPYFKHSGVLSILNSMLNQKGGKSETVSSSVPIGFQTLDKEKVKTPNINDQNKFTTPAVKPVAKKEKKKDSNIIDTVVENGEEYVVVKSNWKFNITKLTANQKEKLRRTREDIPALYQDLSQSQDEFKRVYRMNSVDSMSGMSSKSTAMEKEDATEVLKKMASSSVVPRIIENILTESNKTDCTEPNRNIVESAPPNIDNDHKHIEAKTCKSPRVALKDRVFRNVRNLIEKSGLQNDAKELNSTVNENLLKTPPKKQNVNKHLANSAPPEISSERPSRVKRKPKKFDDLNILSSKKRRTSTNQNNSEALGVKASETQTAESEGSKKPKLNLVDETISTTACEVTKTVTPDGNVSEQNVGQIVDSTNAFSTLGDLDNNAADIKPKNDFLLKEEPDIEEKQDAKYSEPSCGIENLIETDSCNLSDDKSFSKLITPNKMCKEQNAGVPTAKKSGRRKSRIEKELAIDMVEGHPFLKMQSEKRLTRKNINITSPALVKRKTLVEKLNKSKTDTNVAKSEKKQKNKDKLNSSSDEKQIDTSEDIASSQSQDIIESSQDSTVSSSISVKTCKKPKRIPIVSVEPCTDIPKALQLLKEKQDLTNGVASISDDIELGHNKTVVHDGVDVNSTENMDTLPVERDSSSDVIIRSYGEAPIVIRIDQTDTESGTQKTANEDTQSLDPALFSEVANSAPTRPVEQSTTMIEEKCNDVIHATPDVTTQRFDGAQTIAETANVDTDCSPFKDEAQRKQDFMNNTLEISPIKMLSPLQEEKKSPTLETSSDFMVITLSSPVQSNGEPFDKSDSPEIFSNDKISPDKRDQSPPRDECVMSNLSPSSSLSLKKNRPQVRSGGRAAQMLGLCVPDRMQTLTSSEKSVEPEEHRRSMALNTSARRNLRILYNSTGENSEAHDGSEESEFFLKLKRSIPTADSSPSGPILKRKLNDIVDETTVSPASKRKRVSFHDPPVSTTVCVKKYIEPSGLHSPQNSALKRQERQLRAQTTTKTPKRLDTVFKLDTVLTRAVESFSENGTNVAGVTPISQLEQTRLAEVVTTSDLNGTEPVCPALVHCKDGIDRIATKLSSPAKKLLLIREFEGKVETIGDLAKMTELEVNSLSIKAPKVEVAKRVLNDYALRSLRVDSTEACECIDLDDEPSKTDTHTDGTPLIYKEMQTDDVSTVASEQIASTCSDVTQTVEPGANSTSNLIISSLSEGPDFLGQLCGQLDERTKKEIACNLSLEVLTEALLKKVGFSKSFDTLSPLLGHSRTNCSSIDPSSITQLSVIQNYLCDSFDSKDLIIFCSELLRKVSEKPA